MQSVESGQSPSNHHASRAGSSRRGMGWASKGSGITFAAMVVVFLVALIFAANQNDVIGWLLVVISAGWLVLATLVALGVRRGARSVDRRMKDFSASLAPRVGEAGTTSAGSSPVSGQSGPGAPVAADSMRDTKLDHSFKIVQVQTRVVTEELAKGPEADTDMVARALETIEITSSNARDMIKESRSGSRSAPTSGARPDAEGPISGEVIN